MSRQWLLIAILVATSSVMGFRNDTRSTSNRRRPVQHRHHKHSDDTSFDFFIFTQAWPPTTCFVWEEKSPINECNLPKNGEWTIHGLWPTRNKSIGPEFCNHTARFDLGAIDSLRQQMSTKWLDVHKGAKPQDFWKHEWEKHGTCSMNVPNMNSELKYFKKGLELYDNYDMKTVLTKANILPNQKYNFRDYLDGVKKILGKNAYIECQKNPNTNLSYVSELRICFDKNFTLTDCNATYHYPTNCNKRVDVIYPSKPPPVKREFKTVRLHGQ